MMATVDPSDPLGAPQPPLRAVIAGGAPTDLEHFNAEDGMALFGVSAAQNPALYHYASPLYHVTAKAPPFFIYHGSADDTVPLQQAEALRKALADAGVPVELYVVHGAEHAGSTEGAMDPALGFLDRQLKP
jgi:dipeptidyl aminopeptidase/acylaminoacyl peptidase